MAGYAIGTVPSPETIGVGSASRNGWLLPPALSNPLHDLSRVIAKTCVPPTRVRRPIRHARVGRREYACSNANVKRISITGKD
jgi:hypothetical protein